MPQGSLQQNQGKMNIRITVFTILAIHVVVLGGLLMQGCSKESGGKTAANATPTVETNSLPPVDTANAVTGTNGGAGGLPPIGTNTPEAVLPGGGGTSTVGHATGSVANNLTPPPNNPPPIDVGPASTKEYVVAKGDTLAKIAKANGVTVDAIMKANQGLVASKLQIKQKIQIPASAGSSGSVAKNEAAGGAEAGAASGSMYEVKPGDNLGKIAKSHGTSVKAIQVANNLKSTSIKVGQKLKLPAKAGVPASEATKEAAATPIAPAPAPAGAAAAPTTKQ